jgi:hypothetical protein
MNKLTRRTILKGIAFGSLSSLYLTPLVSFAFQQKSVPSSDSPELKELRDKWFKEEERDPQDFLRESGLDEHSTPTCFREQIEKDFKQNNTFEISGFILSKTEVALAASLIC